MRQCSKQGCVGNAVGTLTYDYQAQTAVLGPLASVPEPHTYDLCEKHIRSLTVPKGWEVLRLEINFDQSVPSDDDLMELAEAVKEAARPAVANHGSFSALLPPLEESSRGRFTVVSNDDDVPDTNSSGSALTGPFESGDSKPSS